MKSVAEKLGIKEGKKVLVIDAPLDYKEVQGSIPLEQADVIQVFISSEKNLRDFIEKSRPQLKATCALWVTYPKASPHLGINRDIIAKFLEAYDLKGVAICSVNDKWSALRFKAGSSIKCS